MAKKRKVSSKKRSSIICLHKQGSAKIKTDKYRQTPKEYQTGQDNCEKIIINR